jgi:cysteinyl-tRNA synthetase
LRDISGWQDRWGSVDPDRVFIEALEDDLNTPRALAALFEIAREVNRSDSASERTELAARLRASADMLGLLGAEPERWFTADESAALSGEEIDKRLAERNKARAARDFAEADRIRDELDGLGISIEDGPDGTRWRRG